MTAQNPRAVEPSSPLADETPLDGVAGWVGSSPGNSEPSAGQLAELRRWLRNPNDPRSKEQLKADLRRIGDGVHPRPTRVWPNGLRWMTRWFR